MIVNNSYSITDSFEGGHLLRFGNNLGTNGVPAVDTFTNFGITAMDGTYCMRLGAFDCSLLMPLTPVNEMYGGFYFKTDNPSSQYGQAGGSGSSHNHRIVSFWLDGSNATCNLKINPTTQKLELWSGGFYYTSPVGAFTGTPPVFLVASTQANTFVANTLYHIQWHIKLAGGASVFEVKLDDILVLTFNGTLAGTLVDHVLWHSAGSTYSDSGTSQYYDNIIINDTTGIVDNSWPGIIRFKLQPINAAGTYAQFTPVPVQANYLNVKDVPNDADVTYNTALATGLKDSFLVTPNGLNPANVTYKAYFEECIARKTSGTMTLKLGVRRSGTDYLQSSGASLGVSYRVFDNRLVTDPSTLLAWTAAGIDAAESMYSSA